MNIVLCESAEKRAFTAGNKARTDTVNVLLKAGYKHISLFTSKNAKPIILIQMIGALIRTITKANKNDIVFIQYPYYPAVVNKSLISMLSFGRRIKRYKVCLLIHDSVGLRNENNSSGILNNNILNKEVKLIDKADFIVSHNNSMNKAFKEVGGKKRYFTLGPFYYLYEGPMSRIIHNKKPTICIAGNLSNEKCGYVYKLDQIKNCNFNLYGIGYSGVESENISYKGSFSPEDLIQHLEGNYGLVWDGDMLDTCNGVFGRYLKYNNPHKFSLYIAAGLPVIVWKESALAYYVKEKGIGICVGSIQELESTITNIDNETYDKMINNVIKYREQITNGNNLLHIVSMIQ